MNTSRSSGRQAFVTVDLGFGDSGKGATVDFLCREHGASLVVRYSGGAQAGHNVELPDGTRHKFSQFGSGYLAGVDTFLGPAMIIKPSGILKEAEALSEIAGGNPVQLLRIHPDCLVATPYHQAMNRIREDSRGVGRHGSCGMGIGETRSYWLKYGMDAVFAGDLKDCRLLEKKLSLMRQRLWGEAMESNLIVLSENLFQDWAAKSVAWAVCRDSANLDISEFPQSHRAVVFEASQGVLLDETVGFPPHNTWSDVTMRPANELINSLEFHYDKVTTLGITRAYTTRHGAGPLPTSSVILTEATNDSGNLYNDWQGKMRAGWLDMTLLKYATTPSICGSKLDGIVVNHLDHIDGGNGCEYAWFSPGYMDNQFFTPPAPNLQSQQSLGRILDRATPKIVRTSRGELLDEIGKIAPIYMTADGPTWKHRKRTD